LVHTGSVADLRRFLGVGVQLETSRFGAIEVDAGEVLTFTQPIIGFQEFRRFVLLRGAGPHEVSWLQSVDAGDLAFIVMDPRAVVADYAVHLSASELSELAVQAPSELEVYTLVVVPPDDATAIRTNLKAPILINPRQRLAKQSVLENSQYAVRFLLSGASPRPEVSHARADA
jgi:flagellar assembly factor FliW